jgi:hypothetical protein
MSEETRKALIDQTAVNVFVPTEAAFRKIINVPWVNLIYNQALIDKVIYCFYQGLIINQIDPALYYLIYQGLIINQIDPAVYYLIYRVNLIYDQALIDKVI